MWRRKKIDFRYGRTITRGEYLFEQVNSFNLNQSFNMNDPLYQPI